MYNEKKRVWISDCPDEEKRIKYYKDAEEGKAEALFKLASHMLSEASSGGQSAEAVYLMEQAAGDGYPPAMYAMGQLFHWGWAVQKNADAALGWYRKAAACGYEPALRLLKQRRRRRWAAWCMGVIAAVLAFLAAWTAWKGAGWLYGAFPFLKEALQQEDAGQSRGEVKVGEDTELVETVSYEEFDEKLRELVQEYDDELVVSGQVATNRLLLKFEGEELDLTDFFADHVIARENNMVVVQFSTEEEAQRCLEELKKLEMIQFVEMDAYYLKASGTDSGEARDEMILENLRVGFARKSMAAGSGSDDSGAEAFNRVQSASGYEYYSWGAEAMGFPELAGYAALRGQGSAVKVAVLDSGVEPHDETQDRILEGWDIYGGNGQTDYDLEAGHGTHVAGTILDCTQGADVEIIPVGVFEWDSFWNDTFASKSAVISGLEYAILAGADVINMSLGGSTDGSEGESYMLQEALDAGIIVVAAAGNEADDTEYYWPACEESCIVVGAIDDMCDVAFFSNYGSTVDVVAPGVDIISDGTGSERLRILTGTSQAAPHIAAMAALLRMAYPDASQAQIEKYIKDYSGKPAGALQELYGAGIPLCSLFVEE